MRYTVPMHTVRTRIRVYGTVQGVAFRPSAKEEADRLGLSGFARNETDGSVTIEVEGGRDAVGAFVAWARGGPERAEVSRLDLEEIPIVGYEGFVWT